MRNRTTFIIATLTCGIPCSVLPAQELSLNPATGNYSLRYFSDELNREVAIEIIPPNKIAPTAELALVRRGVDGAHVYSYTIRNKRSVGSLQGIGLMEMVCPPRAFTSVVRTEGWDGSARGPSARTLGRDHCVFLVTDDAGILPGEAREGIELATQWLPAISSGNFWGLAEPFQFPPEEQAEHAPELHNLIRMVDGVGGGWVRSDLVSPGRDPAQYTNPMTLLRAISGDLSQACTLAWITNGGVCRSLQVKLSHAETSLQGQKVSTTRNELESFLAELDAQHGPQPGKHVNENAYWLLRTNVEYLLSRL